MDIFLLYLFTRLDPLANLFIGGLVLLPMIAGVLYGIRSDMNLKPEWSWWSKSALMAWALVILGLVFVPSQKDAAIILAGSAILDVAKSETAGRLASMKRAFDAVGALTCVCYACEDCENEWDHS